MEITEEEHSLRWRVITMMGMLTALLFAGFLVGAWANENSEHRVIQYSSITYENHNPATAKEYVAEYVGDQSNTFGLMQTLPLNTRTSYLAIVDQGVRVTLENVDMLAENAQYNMLYSTAIVMNTITNCQSVTYLDASYEIVITRDFINTYLPAAQDLELDSDKWNEVRDMLPEASSYLEPVVTPGGSDPLSDAG